MTYNFDEMVNRTHTGNMKEFITPALLREKGITSFAAAEMDFKTAPSIIESVVQMAKGGVYGFTIPTEEYYDAVRWWLRNVRNWEVEKEWIMPVLGTIYSVASAIRMTCIDDGPGRLIVQSPVYYRYEQAATRMGVETVHNDLKIVNGHYEMDFEDLEVKMADPENKLLVLCNAHNPIARVWTRKELEKVAALSAKYHVPVLSDEIFGEMTFDGHVVTPYASLEEGQAYAMTVVSLGKAFNFTGVNHANIIIPNQKLRERYDHVRYETHYGSMGPFEYASVLGAYNEEGLEWFQNARTYIQENAHRVQEFMAEKLPQVHVFPVEGTSVCWMDWSALKLDGAALTEYLVKEALFDVESGSDYSEDCGQFVRMNLSSTCEQIDSALKRLEEAFCTK
jgi:cysteine-S-conjugate beta-lyase